jgi:serine/threonine protein kinase
MVYTVENICGLLIRSKLLTADEVKTLYQRWLDETHEPADQGQFTRWLSSNHYVTEYQAALLAKGHADDFFLNQYKILDRLGRGRMAGVYKAVHQLGQMVAIKVLPPSRARDSHMLGRFLRESRLAMRLKHPNVVRAFQVGEANGLHYLVMEYLEGETLDEVIQRRKQLPAGEAVRLVHQALLGLQHIHEQGLIHRDLKPSNLMLVPGAPADTTLGSTVKILDIGLGRAMFDESSPAPPREAEIQLTAEGVLLGTPDYLSPDQARDPRSADIRADIYSIGCVLYHLLAGQPPFPDTNIISQMVRHATEPPRPLKNFNVAIPDGLQQIVSTMLAKDPGQRYPTPERAAQALQAFLAGGEPPRSIDAEPQMRKYLTWLETGGNGESAASPERVEAQGPAVPEPSGKAIPSSAASAKKHRSKKHKRRKSGLATAKIKNAGRETEHFDVELVPAAALRKPPAQVPESVWHLTRRDWVLLGIGAGAAIAAGAIGWLVAWYNQADEEQSSD